MIPEALLALLVPMFLGAMGISWRRADGAFRVAQSVADKVDAVELKMAEHYLTKKDFEMSMDRLFRGIDRLEKKMDFHIQDQAVSIRTLKNRLREQGEELF